MDLLDTCIILCGGKSSRMGENKAFITFNNMALISYQYKKIKKLFKNVFISTKAPMKEAIISALYKDLSKFYSINNLSNEIKDSIINDSSNINHPLQGILSSLDYLKKDIFIISVDCPFLQFDTIKLMISYKEKYDVVYASTKNEINPLISFWRKTTTNEIRQFLTKDNTKIRILLQILESKQIICTDNELININTKLDYKEALKNMGSSNNTKLRIIDGTR